MSCGSDPEVLLPKYYENGDSNDPFDDDLDLSFFMLQDEVGNSEQAAKKKELFHRIDEDLDYSVALMLQEEEAASVQARSNEKVQTNIPEKQLSVVDSEWEKLDPNPDIHSLFVQFNYEFFWGALENVEVRWSPRMTLCAGVCCYEGRGGLCSVRLSQPLLKFRPRCDLVETLLHEMIHAYLFVTANNKDHDAHGPEFLKHMNRINAKTGAKISVYHSFHDEVDYQRQHWWKCNGPCQHRKPYFGIVKRAMNRAPSARDLWWADHQAKCGGTFTKIKEPEKFGGKKQTGSKTQSKIDQQSKDIRGFFSPASHKEESQANKIHDFSSSVNKSTPSSAIPVVSDLKGANVHTISSQPKISSDFVPFSGKGFALGGSASGHSKIQPWMEATRTVGKGDILKTSTCFTGAGHTLGNSKTSQKDSDKFFGSSSRGTVDKRFPNYLPKQSVNSNSSVAAKSSKRPFVTFSSDSEDGETPSPTKKRVPKSETTSSSGTYSGVQNASRDKMVNCPVCNSSVKEQHVNSHLDTCLM